MTRRMLLTGTGMLAILAMTFVATSAAPHASLTAQVQNAPSSAETSSSSSSEGVTTPACDGALQNRLTQQVRLFDMVVFGIRTAEEMPVNSTRYDEDGIAWMKTETNHWVTATNGHEDEVKTDTEMNDESEYPDMNSPVTHTDDTERTGILEERGVLTSQLIPQLAQGLRALWCRQAMVCGAVLQSFLRTPTDAHDMLHVTTEGCEELVTPPIDECRFGNADPQEAADQENTAAGFAEQVVRTQCSSLIPQIMNREKALMDVAVSYDAAQRSILQLGGSMQDLLSGLHGDVLAPIEQTLPLLWTLSDERSCITPQCNE